MQLLSTKSNMIKVGKVLNLDNQKAKNRSIIYKYGMDLHTSLHLIKTKRIHRRGTTAKKSYVNTDCGTGNNRLTTQVRYESNLCQIEILYDTCKI